MANSTLKIIRSCAEFSPCRNWRYSLFRGFDGGQGAIAFIGLNPSTADERVDDPTIRRCLRFARDWGGCGLVMLNAYGLRSTDPTGLWKVPDPVGPDCDKWIIRWMARCPVVVCAWGVHCEEQRARYVSELVRATGRQPMCLGVTKSGAPKHPLYLRADSVPVLYSGA